jgi:predicted GH43/DUF377 family glycosyl hydrolase
MAQSTVVPPIERLNQGQPILRKVENHPWENRVVFNPGAVLVEDRPTLDRVIGSLPFDRSTRESLRVHGALCFLLYRAQGAPTPEYDYRRSSIGLAVLTPALKLLARHSDPIIKPDNAFEDLGVEDPRITRIGERFYMFYCGYSTGPEKNRMRIALASSVDLIHWEKHGLLKGKFNEIDNKNGMLFPLRVNNKFLMLHRPIEGKDALSIHLAEADDILGEWTSCGKIMSPIPNPEFKDVWIGGGAPPLPLPGGRFLLLYHMGNRKSDGKVEYDFGIAVGDPAREEFIVRRDQPLLRPGTPSETIGDADLGVNNVVFICAAHFFEEDLYFPYAGADSVVLGGCIRRADLLRYVEAW